MEVGHARLAVAVVDLRKNFGAEAALKGISFSVPEGKLLGIIGPDGAGKTTLLRILVTLITPDGGGATVLGRDVVADFAEVRRLIGYMPQKFSLYQDLSVRENLLFFADVFGVPPAERRRRMEQLLAFSRLGPFQHRRAAHLSGGMKQKLALSCALIHTPKLLVLDEPTTGVDPVSRREFWDILSEIKRQGITILLSTPYMDEATDCDLLLLMHRGEIMREGPPAALLSSYGPVLYKVTSSAGSMGMPPADMPPPPGMSLMYPLAGDLHIAGPEAASPAAILSYVKTRLPSADAVERAVPTIEDLLFLLLSERETA